MKKAWLLFFVIVIFSSCSKTPGQEWVRSVLDENGNPVDTFDITFYANKINVDFSTNLKPSKMHGSSYSYQICDSAVNPQNSKDVIYLVKSDDGIYHYLNFYRFEKDRMTVDRNSFWDNVNARLQHDNPLPDLKKDARKIFADTERSFFSPMFVTKSHLDSVRMLRKFVSVNADTVRMVYRLKLDFVRKNKDRLISWGRPGSCYMTQEPEFLAMEEMGLDPFPAYAQLISSGYYANYNDSVIRTCDSIYRAELWKNYYSASGK